MPIDRASVEDFLFLEADLLDSWRLAEWAGLFTADAHYLVHSSALPLDASPDTTLFFIADNKTRINGRTDRLKKRAAIAEFPHSKTRHFVTNVRASAGPDGSIVATCSLLVHRWREQTDTFCGQATYVLVEDSAGYKIREKRVVLDSDDLHAQGRISIIL